MKALKRNKSEFFFATYAGKAEVIVDGYHTFENTPSYSEWQPYKANISPARGENSAELFGSDVSYDKTIVVDDLSCPMDENTVLAIDFVPDSTTVTKYDYIVTKKAKSLNSLLYAVKKVKVNG